MKVFYLRGFVVFLTLTALIAVITVLSGQSGDLQVKILASSFSVSLASICAMSSAVLMEQRRSKLLGALGIAVAALALLLFNTALWLKGVSGTLWQTAFCGVTLMIGLAYGFLLQLPRLLPAQRWMQRASGYAIALSVALICAGIVSEAIGWPVFSVGYWQVSYITAIAVVLLSVLIPVFLRIGNAQTAPKTSNLEALTLEPLGDGVYRDAGGQRYAVERLEPLAVNSGA